MLRVRNEISAKGLRAGLVAARLGSVQDTPPELRARIEELIAQRKSEDYPPPDLKAAVRDMLRAGGFKPSGRSKPASEYLAQAAREDRFPFINNLVDINNYISLLSGLPASLLDLDVTSEDLILRFGRVGDLYVFNEAGQEIDLTGLMCLCRADEQGGVALGNPVKDSMAAKLKPQTTAVVGVLFAPAGFVQERVLRDLLNVFSELLCRYGQFQDAEIAVV